LLIVKSPINHFNGAAAAMEVVRLIRGIEEETQTKCELIIGDTLARMSAGANENAGEDMGTVLAHAELIRREAKAHVLLIHHSGKDQARGARGWSGLRAAIDTEIEVTSDETTGLRVAEVTKQRDLSTRGDRIGFRLTPVEMGLGQWGNLRTSCIVEAADAPIKASKSKRVSEIGGAVLELLRSRGTSAMRKSDLSKHFDGRYPSSSVYREVAKLIDRGRLNEAAGMVSYCTAFEATT
jgi:hypothetical protein